MKDQKVYEVSRVLNAPLSLVWKVHTEVKHMAAWWGPAGFKMLKNDLDFRVGGVFHYGMESPDGHKMWGILTYREIVPQTKIVTVTSFSDENGGITRHPMSNVWPLETLNTLTLTESNGKTTITIRSVPLNANEEECNMFNNSFDGMNQGFGGMFKQLEDYVSDINK